MRYLAGGARVDNWALSAFRRRHGGALNDCFTQVLEMARELGLGKLGRVAIDSTRIKANASGDRVETEQKLRNERATRQKLAAMPARLQRLRKSGLKKLSPADEEARFLRQRGGRFELSYTGEIAVSDDHLIVAQRVTQNPTDNGSLLPMIDQVSEQCGVLPEKVLADSGYFSVDNLEQMEQRKLDGYVPDSNLAHALNRGTRCPGPAHAPVHQRMRAKLTGPEGKALYARRKAIVEPVFGVLK